MTYMTKDSLRLHKENQKRSNIKTVRETLLQLNDKINPSNRFYEKKNYKPSKNFVIGITAKDLCDYMVSNNNFYKMKLQIIERNYEEGKYNTSVKDNKIKEAYGECCISLRTVYRILDNLILEGDVERTNNHYVLSRKYIKSARNHLDIDSYELLKRLMQLHKPLYNNLQDNIQNLVTFFGIYVFLCLLEVSRPIDESLFENRKHLRQINKAEKNRIAELLSENIILPKTLFTYFLETFLNQPEDATIEKIKELDYEGKRNGKYIYKDKDGNEYDHIHGVYNTLKYFIDENKEEYYPEKYQQEQLKKAPQYLIPRTDFDRTSNLNSDSANVFFELDQKTYESIRETFERMFPEVYVQIKQTILWSLFRGIKHGLIVDYASSKDKEII